MGKPNIHIFDLDRTITRMPTYTPFLLGAAKSQAPWRLALVPLIMPFLLAYVCKLLNRKSLKQIMHLIMLGGRVARSDVTEIAEKFAQNIVANGLFADILSVMQAAQSRGERVMIATASHRFYVEALAQKLGVTDIVATASVWAGDALTPTISGENCYGAGKLRMLKTYFFEQNIDRGAYNLIFYSDHISDLPCLDFSDVPVAKNASPKLLVVARQRGWQIL
jgi:HAD superfamily hydrolase (TIGR01490 family)